MVLTPTVFVVTVAVIFAGFAVVAFIAERLDRRDERRLRDECRARETRSGLSRIMADSLLIRPELPEHLHARYDAIFEIAVRHAYEDELAGPVSQLEELVDADFRPLAPVVELHGHSKGVA